MSKTQGERYLAVEEPDNKAVVDFLVETPERKGAMVTITLEGNTLRIVAQTCEEEDTCSFEFEEWEIDLSKDECEED